MNMQPANRRKERVLLTMLSLCLLALLLRGRLLTSHDAGRLIFSLSFLVLHRDYQKSLALRSTHAFGNATAAAICATFPLGLSQCNYSAWEKLANNPESRAQKLSGCVPWMCPDHQHEDSVLPLIADCFTCLAGFGKSGHIEGNKGS